MTHQQIAGKRRLPANPRGKNMPVSEGKRLSRAFTNTTVMFARAFCAAGRKAVAQ